MARVALSKLYSDPKSSISKPCKNSSVKPQAGHILLLVQYVNDEPTNSL
jgi:hypothetical protein